MHRTNIHISHNYWHNVKIWKYDFAANCRILHWNHKESNKFTAISKFSDLLYYAYKHSKIVFLSLQYTLFTHKQYLHFVISHSLLIFVRFLSLSALHLSKYISIYQSIYLSIFNLSFHLSITLSIYLSIQVSIHTLIQMTSIMCILHTFLFVY